MLNPKKIIFPAVFGFVLSFFISIIATHRFLRSMFRGLIFAVVFALLFMAIDFIFERFLDGEGAPAASKSGDAKSGSRVDITISDEELTEDGEDLHFPVSQNRMPLSRDDTMEARARTEPAPSAGQPDSIPSSADSPEPSSAVSEPVISVLEDEAPGESAAFTPVSIASGAPAVEKASVTVDGGTSDFSSGAGVDDLPEIADFDADLGDEGGSAYVEDTDFASNGSIAMYTERPTFSDGSKASDHDAATIAKAIQTALKRDE